VRRVYAFWVYTAPLAVLTPKDCNESVLRPIGRQADRVCVDCRGGIPRFDAVDLAYSGLVRSNATGTMATWIRSGRRRCSFMAGTVRVSPIGQDEMLNAQP
jgi:hypothetical protein